MTTTTTGEQFELLVGFMERNDGIAKNFLNAPQFKEQSNNLWDSISDELNEKGPPIKSVTGWKKVWKDYKYNIKLKIKHNKKSISTTGGGPFRCRQLSQLEERVDRLLDLTNEINGTGAKHFGCSSRTHFNEPLQEFQELEMIPEAVEVTEIDNPVPIPQIINRPLRKQKETVKTLLKRQIEMQEKFYSRKDKYHREKLRVQKEIRDGQKEIIRIKKEKLIQDKNIQLQKMRQKADELELKRLELDLKERELNEKQLN